MFANMAAVVHSAHDPFGPDISNYESFRITPSATPFIPELARVSMFSGWPPEKTFNVLNPESIPKSSQKSVPAHRPAAIRDHAHEPAPEANESITLASELKAKPEITSSFVKDNEAWTENDIPEELGNVGKDELAEIRAIVQETLDQHRALRASKLHSQAIVVRTTITMETSGNRESVILPTVESSATATTRLPELSLSTERLSSEYTTIESASSTDSSIGEHELRNLRNSMEMPSSMSSQESLHSISPTAFSKSRKERENGGRNQVFLKFLPGSAAGKFKTSRHPKDPSDSPISIECTTCFDEIHKDACASLICEHQYCSSCLSQLVTTALVDEHTFPPKCCLREIPRSILQLHISPTELNDYDAKASEYATEGIHYYRGSLACRKWIDVQEGRREADIAERFKDDEIDILREEIEARTTVEAVKEVEKYVPQAWIVEQHKSAKARQAKEAEEARQIEYKRVEGISKYFQYLRKSLERNNLRQKKSLVSRHELEMSGILRMQSDLASLDIFTNRIGQINSQRHDIVISNEAKNRDLRRKHRADFAAMTARHQENQDQVLFRPIQGSEVQRGALIRPILDMLIEAQSVERNTLQMQQERQLEKWDARGRALLEEFDGIMQEEKSRFEKLHETRTQEIITALNLATSQIRSDWKWYETLLVARQTALNEDENRILMSGSHAPNLDMDHDNR